MLKCFVKVHCCALIIAVAACSENRSVNPTSNPIAFSNNPGTCNWPNPAVTWTGSPGTIEEEVFGNISSSGGPWSVSLIPDGQTSQATYFSSSVRVNRVHPCSSGGHANANADWGWYGFGPEFGTQCIDTQNAQSNQPEHHRAEGAPEFPPQYETHCANAGSFTLTLSKDEVAAFVRPVDFLQYQIGAFFDIAKPGVSGNASHDVFVNVKDVDGAAAPNAVIDVSASLDQYDQTWFSVLPQQSIYHIPSNFTARFRASNSTSPNGFGQYDLLVRYFWNWTVDPSDRTGFTNTSAGGPGSRPLVRAVLFGAGSRTVLAHVVEPDDRLQSDPTNLVSTSYGAAVPMSFQISGPLTAVIVANPTTPVVNSPVQFSDNGLDGGGSNGYQWNFGDGTSSTLESPSHIYTTSGTKTVSLTKTDYGIPYSTTLAVNVICTTACPPSAFTLVSCTDTTIKGRAYRSYNVAWTRGEFSTGSSYEVGQTSTSNPTGATVIRSGPSSTTSETLGTYLRSQSQLLYFWVRHTLSGGASPSAWVPLDNQPMNPNGACF